MALDTFEQAPSRPRAPKLGFDIRGLTMAELVSLRLKIDAALGDVNLGDIDLSMELILQYRMTKMLFVSSMDEEEIALNQRVQAANSCSTILAQLAKLQVEVYDTDRLKKLEGAIYDTFKTLDSEPGLKVHLSQLFLDRYREALNNPAFTPKPPVLL